MKASHILVLDLNSERRDGLVQALKGAGHLPVVVGSAAEAARALGVPGLDAALVELTQYKREDGFLGIENCHNSICTDRNDNIWFGTMNGLVHYNAAYKTGIQAPPRLHLSDVLLFNQSVSQSGYNHCFASLPDNVLSNLPYNQNHLSFSFEAVHVNFPDQLKYRYMLEGADNHWSAWSTEKRNNFCGIAPGNYCFKSQATFDKNQVSNTEQVCFYIGKPYWEENGFRFAVALLVLALIIGIFKVRESSIRKKALAQTRELTLKNELLTLEQKALQLKLTKSAIISLPCSGDNLIRLSGLATLCSTTL